MASSVRTSLLLLSLLVSCGQARCAEEYAAALRGAANDGRPVLVLVRNPREVGTLDAAHWLSEAPEIAGVLTGLHYATVWNDEESLKGFPQLRNGPLCLLDAQGRLVADLPVPALREQLKPLLESALRELTPLDELAVRAEAGQAGEETVRRVWQRLVDAGETERAVRLLAQPANRALAQTLSAEVDVALRQRLRQLRGALAEVRGGGEEAGRAVMREMLLERMGEETALRCVGLLADAVVRWGGDEDFKLLQKKIERDTPRGRAAALAALRAGQACMGRGNAGETKDWWRLAERAAGGGESPLLLRAAARQRWAAEGKDSPLRSRWRKREVLDVVVLVADSASFLKAVGRWTDKTFFPVLFQEDHCAPRFIAAFKPARVIVLPPAEDARPPQAADLYRVLLESWAKDGEGRRLPAQVDREALLRRLRDFSDDPQGVVFTNLDSGEWPGALALAAGRFQGLEFLPGEPNVETSAISAAQARELARRVQEGLTQWGLPRERRACAVTLAGDYPLFCRGPKMPDGADRYAVDDWIGRDSDGGRLAFTARLTNGRVASAYMAACALFLQPATVDLMETKSGPSAGPGLAAAERTLRPRWNVLRSEGDDPALASGLAGQAWRGPLFSFLQTDGPGATADDIPPGDARAMVFTQPCAGDDPGNLATLCGRALLGGAFWCAGGVGDPYLEGWPRPEEWSARMGAGAAWGAAFRRDDGSAFGWPWRVVLCGDPLFCLRDEPAKRRACRAQDGPVVHGDEKTLVPENLPAGASPAEWRASLQQARWSGDRAAAQALLERIPEKMDGPMLAMVLEERLRAGAVVEAWRHWSTADDAARREILPALYARQAACALMGHALNRKQPENAMVAFDAFLLTGPNMNSTSRWLDRIGDVAQHSDRLPAFLRWLAAHATDEGLNAYRKSFEECARRIGQGALENGDGR